jgi:hypothetical protein
MGESLMRILSLLRRTAETAAQPWFVLVIRRALAGRKMRFEVSGEESESALNGWTGHGDEIAKAFPFVKSEDFAELLEDRLAALPLLNFLQQRRKGVGFHPASGALAAGFDGEEFGDL